MCGVFAEFERSVIQETIKAGLAKVKAKGKPLGRPWIVTDETHAQVREARANGGSIREIARQLNSSRSKVQRIVSG